MDKYLSPESGNIATIFFASFSGRLANSIAAVTAAPDEIPTNIPSFAVSCAAVLNADSLSTVITSSYISVSRTSGTKPAPIP